MNRAQVLNATHYSHSCTKCSSIELTAHELMRASDACDLLWNFVDETTVRPLSCAFHVVQVHVPHKGRTQCDSWCQNTSWATMRQGRMDENDDNIQICFVYLISPCQHERRERTQNTWTVMWLLFWILLTSDSLSAATKGNRKIPQ